MTDHICSDHLHCSLDHQPSVNRLLHELGHFAQVDEDGFAHGGCTWEEVCELVPSAIALQDAIASYQRFRPWLKEDGIFGKCTHMASVQELGCRCGCPDLMRRPASGLPRWGDECFKGITTWFESAGMRSDFGDRTAGGIWQEGDRIINAACGAKLLPAGSDPPMIRAKMGSMGSGVLAWSYLVTSGCSDRIRQEYNRSRTWGYHDFLWVSIHEELHALGIGHTNERNNIMSPYYSPSLSAFGSWDKSQLVKRYGPPVVAPEPPTPPQPPVPPTPPGELRVAGGSGSFVVTDGENEWRLPVDHSHRGIVDII